MLLEKKNLAQDIANIEEKIKIKLFRKNNIKSRTVRNRINREIRVLVELHANLKNELRGL